MPGGFPGGLLCLSHKFNQKNRCFRKTKQVDRCEQKGRQVGSEGEWGCVCEGTVGATQHVQRGLGLLWALPAASPTIFIEGSPGGHEAGGGFKEAIAYSRKLGASGGPTLLVKCLCLLPGVK